MKAEVSLLEDRSTATAGAPASHATAVAPEQDIAVLRTMPTMELDQAVARGTVLGRYVLLTHIGAGSMGVVYAAYDPELDRKVAVKLLRARPGGSEGDADGRARLLREAQALARLSHPNVVAVHDVGAVGERVWLAMEFVEGATLQAWGEQQRRSWREVLEVMRRAGEGLAAAHATGLVHRDFKPDNVMVAHDGRVRVMDLGLARIGPNQVTEESPDTMTSDIRSHPELTLRVTQQGMVVGTPAYMAPEQFRHAEVDAAADIFAYCVTFWEALFGERPFAGTSIDELVLNVTSGRPRPPPRDRRSPPWLRRLLERGLAVEPGQRWPSMQALLAELDRGRTRGRWFALVTASLAAFGLGAGIFAAVQTAETCDGGETQIAPLWAAPRSEAIERAFLATRVDFAGETWALTRRLLDDYTQDWKAMFADACVAHRRGEQSSSVLDLRMMCLQRRRSELAALLDVFADANPETVSHAVQAVGELPDIRGCADLHALMEEQRRLGLPRDPALAAGVEALRARLAIVAALERAGQIQQGLERAKKVVHAAQGLEYPPVLAEALFLYGSLLLAANSAAEAEAVLWQANVTAMQSGHEMVQARALVKEVYVLGYDLAEPRAAERVIQSATAMVTRVAPDSPLAGELRNNIAVVRANQGRYEEAEALHRENLAFRRRILPADHVDIGFTLANLSIDLEERRRYAEAEAMTREAMILFRRGFGPQHPHTLLVETLLGIVLFDMGRHAEAEAALDRSLHRLVAIVGADKPGPAEARCVAAQLRLKRGDLTALAELERAYELGEQAGYVAARYRMRLALADALWAHAPAQRARSLQLAREAQVDGEMMNDPVRVARVRAWLAVRDGVQ